MGREAGDTVSRDLIRRGIDPDSDTAKERAYTVTHPKTASELAKIDAQAANIKETPITEPDRADDALREFLRYRQSLGLNAHPV